VREPWQDAQRTIGRGTAAAVPGPPVPGGSLAHRGVTAASRGRVTALSDPPHTPDNPPPCCVLGPPSVLYV